MHYAVEPSLIPKIKSEYIQGKGSVREVCEKFGVGKDYKAIEVRASKGKWSTERERYLKASYDKTLIKAQTEAEEWEDMVRATCKKEWLLATSSIEGIVSSDASGGIDPEALGGYIRARKLLDDMARRALGLVDPAQRIDITSQGKGLGDSFADAMLKLQQSPIPPPTSEEVDRIIECEIIEEEEK